MRPAPETALEGVWALVRAEMSGEKAPDLVVQNTELQLLAGGYAVSFAGRVVDRGSYEVMTAAGEATMTWHGVTGPNAGRTIPCIFQLVRDRLRVCYGLDGVKPTGFSAGADEARYLATYRRKTPTR